MGKEEITRRTLGTVENVTYESKEKSLYSFMFLGGYPVPGFGMSFGSSMPYLTTVLDIRTDDGRQEEVKLNGPLNFSKGQRLELGYIDEKKGFIRRKRVERLYKLHVGTNGFDVTFPDDDD